MRTPARLVVGLLFFGLLVASGLALLQRGIYGWTIFALSPFFLGGLTSWIVRPSSALKAAGLGALSVTVALALLLLLGGEGLGCIAMVLPLALPLGALGALVVYGTASSRPSVHAAAVVLLLPTASLTFDTHAQPRLYEVRTAIEVNAPPEQVWKLVVAFPQLPEPTEWYFHTGLAYPQRARIEGVGVGSTRYCEFSTGPFVEPIEVWDEPRLLQFRVSANPAPMHEWSPYGEVSPMHLQGYMVSRKGQFRLTRLANNRTLLEGTTWYQHGLWPAEYWRWWSDAIIHRIHLRVLNHVRTLSEAGGKAS